MYYVYLLQQTNTHKLYYGYTNDLERRLKEHNKNDSWELIYYEAFKSESDARQRERKLKYYGQTISCLKQRLKGSLKC